MERRKYPRFELKVIAEYRVLTLEEALRVTRTRNISAEGLCFESDEKISAGTRVELKVDLGDKMPPVSLFGEVKWSQETREPGLRQKKFLNGVRLIDMPESDEGRFLKYYCDRMVEKLGNYLKM